MIKTIVVVGTTLAVTSALSGTAASAATWRHRWGHRTFTSWSGTTGRHHRHGVYGGFQGLHRHWAWHAPAYPRAAVAFAAPAYRAVATGVQTGRASFYSGGGRTANGGSVGSATCAHRSLPFGTKVLVTNLANARQAVLTVNDRGPFVRGRLLDVSRGAAGMLGMLHAGVSQIRMEVLGGAG